MRYPLIFSLLLALLPLAARADLQWASSTVFTSALPSEGRATAQFTFTNTGSYPIKVLSTHTTCGCTAAVADSRTVAPGQTGKIDVSFKTLNRRGLYEEPIEVDTNDPAAPRNTITLRVLIRDAVELLPTLLFWQPGEPLDPKTIQVTVTEGFTVTGVTATASDPALQIDLQPVKPGAAYKLTVTPRAPHLRGVVTVIAQIPGRPPRKLAIHVRVS